MSSIVNKLKEMNEVKPAASPMTSYSALYGASDGKENTFMQTRARHGKSSTTAAATIYKSMKETVESVKQVQRNITDEIKQKFKFTINQITSKLTKKSTYESLEEGPSTTFTCDWKTPTKKQHMKTFKSVDNPCYDTPTTSSRPSSSPALRRSQRRKRKANDDDLAGVGNSKNPVAKAMKDLKKSRKSMRKVIKKQDRRATQSQIQQQNFETPRRQKRLQMPTKATPTPAKMARLAIDDMASTPTTRFHRASRYINPGIRTPNNIIDSNNKKRVVRRASSRICGLLVGITNPIAYQLNTKI